MSHSKKRARGHSYYLEVVNKPAQRFLPSCSACGTTGYDANCLDEQKNQHLIAEVKRRYKPLELSQAGLCEICSSTQPTPQDISPPPV